MTPKYWERIALVLLGIVLGLLIPSRVSAYDVGILTDSSGNSYHAHIHKDDIPYGPVLSNITNDTFGKYGHGLAYPETDEAGFESLRGGATPSNIANVSLFFVYDGRDQNLDLEVALTGFPSIGTFIEYHFALRCASDGTFTFTHENIVSPPFFDQFDIPGACSATGQHTMGFIRNHTSLELTMYFDSNIFGPFVYNETQAEGVIDPTALHLGNRQLLTVYETRFWDSPINESLMLDLMDSTNHDHDNTTTGELGAWFFELPESQPPPPSTIGTRTNFEIKTGLTGFELIAWLTIITLVVLIPSKMENKILAKCFAIGLGVLAFAIAFLFENPYRSIAAITGFVAATSIVFIKDTKNAKKEEK